MTDPDRTPAAAADPDRSDPDSAGTPPHGDPLLDTAEGRGDGDDASRQGRPAGPSGA